MKFTSVVCVFLGLCGSAFGADFEGTYQCKGTDPYLSQNYAGTVKITKDKDVYLLEMDYTTGEKSTGTALTHGDDTLFVTFQDKSNLKNIGLQQYTLAGNKMSGNWVYLGQNKLGQEACTRLN